MVTRAKSRKQHGSRISAWSKLPIRERERLTEEYVYRVLSDKPTKRIADKIKKLKAKTA